MNKNQKKILSRRLQTKTKTIHYGGPTAGLSWQKNELVSLKADLKRVSDLKIRKNVA